VNRLSLKRPLTAGEFAFSSVALALLAAIVFTPHFKHGGFYLDDWTNAAATLHPAEGPGIDNALSYFAEVTSYRPVLVVYVPLTYLVFGMHIAHHLIWAAFLAVIVAALLYGVLRTLGLPWAHALAIAGLVLVYPWFDSTRFWATAGQISLSSAFALGGLWLALAGLARHSWRWHASAAALYLLSILTYEVTLPLVAAAGSLYLLRVGWARARGRWAIDLAVAAVAGLWVGTQTDRPASSLSESLDHLGKIVSEGAVVLGRTLLPFGEQQTGLALAAIAIVYVAGLLVYLWYPRRFVGGTVWGIENWLGLLAAGLAIAALGWAMFVPADSYYTPSFYGMNNRVNGVAGIGLIIAIYGAMGTVGALLAAGLPRKKEIAVGVPLVLAICLGATYTHVVRRHTTIWRAAYMSERAALDRLRSEFPSLSPRTAFFVGEYPSYQTFGVPIFATNWDMTGMVRMEYEDGTLNAYPLVSGFRIDCRPDGVGVKGIGAPERTARYGIAVLVNVPSGRSTRPLGMRACKHAAGAYTPGPLTLSVTY
jgi:hypothetical protein